MDCSSVKCPEVLATVADFRDWRRKARGTVGFVATMGALHEGHLSLIERARQLNDNLVVSIFVNPLQFGPKEDFSSYPRTFERDLEHCRRLRVDTLFAPKAEELYPEGKDACTKVIPPPFLADVLEGHFRPGFFTGVATVVSKLFHIVEPDVTIFGEKDYQQLLVIKRMISDLNLPIALQGGPTVRAEDGLALSSRNAYLNDEQRQTAPTIYKILCRARDAIKSRSKDVRKAVEAAREEFGQTKLIDLQYLEVRDGETLGEAVSLDRKIVLLTAVKIGSVRLIDNVILTP